MPFTLFRIDDAFQDAEGTLIGLQASPVHLSNAIRLAVRDTMRQYSNRVAVLTEFWKQENRPFFVATNFSPQAQLGLAQIDGQPIEFNLQNTRIWGLVSAGSPAHRIEAKGPYALRFTGWPFDEFGDTQNFPKFSRARNQFTGRGRNTGRVGIVNTVDRERRQRGATTYPPTYIPATTPGRYGSNRARHLGSITVEIQGPRNEVAYVDHPGFQGRDLSGILLGTSGNAPGGDLNDFYFNTLYNRLNQATGEGEVATRTRTGTQLPTSQREFVVQTGAVRYPGSRFPTFATSRFADPFEGAADFAPGFTRTTRPQ